MVDHGVNREPTRDIGIAPRNLSGDRSSAKYLTRSNYDGKQMTPEQVTLVQESFAKVAPIADQAAIMFYDRLFELAPGKNDVPGRHD
jgi:hypothetical protein